MPDKISEQREDVRFRVLRLLEENPEFSQRDIARYLGVSLGAVNFCLAALVEKGHVKVNNFRAADNKLRYAYLLTPNGIAEKAALTSRFLRRKLREYEALREEIESLLEDAEFEIASALKDSR
ncbi:MarR family EPS-associated transcriptional regulator [Oricola indica]|uniref:MarR family EPS-associated transcriptional regulator n=1 Tax=Oricola indica TaxID=2872591 RepID=UPI003CCB9234